MEISTTEHLAGYTGEIIPDEDGMNPRTDFDNLGTMYCQHGQYDLGDKGADDPREMDEPMIQLPLYLLDHSGLWISTGDFNDPWDSGRVGIIYITLAKVRQEYSAKRVSAQLRARVLQYLEGEVETYNQYLTGDVYGYTITDPAGEIVDSCWGYYGTEYVEQEMKSMLDYHVNKRKQERFAKLKALIRNRVPFGAREAALRYGV